MASSEYRPSETAITPRYRSSTTGRAYLRTSRIESLSLTTGARSSTRWTRVGWASDCRSASRSSRGTADGSMFVASRAGEVPLSFGCRSHRPSKPPHEASIARQCGAVRLHRFRNDRFRADLDHPIHDVDRVDIDRLLGRWGEHRAGFDIEDRAVHEALDLLTVDGAAREKVLFVGAEIVDCVE